jgi:hypothetical protein
LKNALAYYNAGAVVVSLGIVGLAPEFGKCRWQSLARVDLWAEANSSIRNLAVYSIWIPLATSVEWNFGSFLQATKFSVCAERKFRFQIQSLFLLFYFKKSQKVQHKLPIETSTFFQTSYMYLCYHPSIFDSTAMGRSNNVTYVKNKIGHLLFDWVKQCDDKTKNRLKLTDQI